MTEHILDLGTYTCIKCGLSKDQMAAQPECKGRGTPEAMNNIKPIGRPHIDEQIKEDILISLNETIEAVEAGHVSELLIIVRGPDGTWSKATHRVEEFSSWIGRLEIVKQEWIEEYLKQTDRWVDKEV